MTDWLRREDRMEAVLIEILKDYEDAICHARLVQAMGTMPERLDQEYAIKRCEAFMARIEWALAKDGNALDARALYPPPTP